MIKVRAEISMTLIWAMFGLALLGACKGDHKGESKSNAPKAEPLVNQIDTPSNPELFGGVALLQNHWVPTLSQALEKGRTPISKKPSDPNLPASCATLDDVEPEWVVKQKSDALDLELPEANARLQRRMAFWTRLWRDTPDRVYLMFDGRRPSYIYAEIDCRPFFEGKDIEDPEGDALCDKKLVAEKKKAKAALKKKTPPQLAAVLDNDKARIKSAPNNIRFMRGKQHHLREAMERAVPHLGLVEEVFENVGVPKGLSRLSIIESLFKPEVVSHAGAVGAFQLMRPTARPYISVDNGVDERKDVERAAFASATFLKEMHRSLKTWPMVLTGYNTGPTRMRRIIRKHNSDDIGLLADIRTERNFGFDGQNYYASFLAIYQITQALNDAPALRFPRNDGHLLLTKEMSLNELSVCLQATAHDVLAANPALKQNPEGVAKGMEPSAEEQATAPLIKTVPAGYVVNLPLKVQAVAQVEGPIAP